MDEKNLGADVDKCRYHDFFQLYDGPDAVRERCKLCGVEVTYKKGKDGSMDNAKYLSDHIRDFCQSTGSTSKIFEEIYGLKAAARNRKMKEPAGSIDESIGEGKRVMKESLNFWRKMEAKGYTRDEILRMIETI